MSSPMGFSGAPQSGLPMFPPPGALPMGNPALSDSYVQQEMAALQIDPQMLAQDLNTLSVQKYQVPPESPTGIAITARMAMLGQVKAKQDMAHAADAILPFSDPTSMMLKARAVALVNLEPDSPQADALVSQMRQMGGSQNPAVEKLLITSMEYSINNMYNSLSSIQSGLMPGSTASNSIEQRKHVVAEEYNGIQMLSRYPTATYEQAKEVGNIVMQKYNLSPPNA